MSQPQRSYRRRVIDRINPNATYNDDGTVTVPSFFAGEPSTIIRLPENSYLDNGYVCQLVEETEPSAAPLTVPWSQGTSNQPQAGPSQQDIPPEPKLTYTPEEVDCVNCFLTGIRCRAPDRTATRHTTCESCMRFSKPGCDFGDKSAAREVDRTEMADLRAWRRRCQRQLGH